MRRGGLTGGGCAAEAYTVRYCADCAQEVSAEANTAAQRNSLTAAG